VVASNDAMQVAPKRTVPPDWLGTIPDLAIYGIVPGRPGTTSPQATASARPRAGAVSLCHSKRQSRFREVCFIACEPHETNPGADEAIFPYSRRRPETKTCYESRQVIRQLGYGHVDTHQLTLP